MAGREGCAFLSISANILGDSVLNIITGNNRLPCADASWCLTARMSWDMLKFTLLLWDCGSMHFPEFQGSGLMCADFPVTSHLGGGSANNVERSLRKTTNPIRPALILIYEFSRDKLLGMRLSGCRWRNSVVKQM